MWSDETFTELVRRRGTLLDDWRLFRDALRSRVGVEERDRVPLTDGGAFRGLRRALPGRGVVALGDRSTAGL